MGGIRAGKGTEKKVHPDSPRGRKTSGWDTLARGSEGTVTKTGVV